MSKKVLFTFLIVLKFTNSQMNGEFWWLNAKMTKLSGVEPPPPKYEELTLYNTDESDRIIFGDDNDSVTIRVRPNHKIPKMQKFERPKIDINFKDKSQLNVEVITSEPHFNTTEKRPVGNHSSPDITEDVLEFKFPEDTDNNLKWNTNVNRRNISETTVKPQTFDKTTTNEIIYLTGEVPIKIYNNKNNAETPKVEDICTFMKKVECNRRHGIIYNKLSSPFSSPGSQFVCCVLPLSSEKIARMYFPDEIEHFKRNKRSSSDANAQRQRKALLQHYASRFSIYAPVLTRIEKIVPTKIVTPSDDDYGDPYWNIKNIGPNSPYQSNPYINKYDYGGQTYNGAYTAELPKPGLVGIYSDNAPKPPVWTFGPSNPGLYGGNDEVSEEDEENDNTFFGYSTVDPRKVVRPLKTSRPIKFTEYSSNESQDAETQIVSFQSNPDFRVLEGFKLLNLFRNNKSNKNSKFSVTTDANLNSEEYPTSKPRPVNVEEEYDDFFDIQQSAYRECGKIASGIDTDNGRLSNGSQPWLALATRTRKPHSVLCYATIIHPKAAITAAECVYGLSPGDVTIFAGMWDLNEDQDIAQRRLTNVLVHHQYTPRNIDRNLALLYWKQSLQLTAAVQPACMSDPHVGDTCHFMGWGGYDVAMRPRPRSQNAIILTPRACKTRLSVNQPGFNLPKEAFCATIDQKASVTGIGGPLTCNIKDKSALVGIAVLRNNLIVLLPVDWARQVVEELRL